MTPGSSQYQSPLREQQKAATRQLILEAVAEEVAQRGPAEFTVQDVASRAGVALRTVYEHFRTRRDLVEALYDWIDDAFAAHGAVPTRLQSPSDLVAAAADAFRVFEAHPQLTRAMVRLADLDGARPASYHARTESFRQALAPLTRTLDPDDAEAVPAVARYLVSSRAWYAMRFEFGLDPDQTSDILTRTLAALFRDLESGHTPPPPGDGRHAPHGKEDNR